MTGLVNINKRVGKSLLFTSLAFFCFSLFAGNANPPGPELEKMGKQAGALINSGKYAEAEVLIKKILARLSSQKSKNAELEGQIWGGLGIVYSRQKKYAAAINALTKALRIFEKKFGKISRNLTGVLLQIADVRMLSGDFRQASATYNRLMAIYKRASKYGQYEMGQMLARVGDRYEKHGKYLEAGKLYSKACGIFMNKDLKKPEGFPIRLDGPIKSLIRVTRKAGRLKQAKALEKWYRAIVTDGKYRKPPAGYCITASR